jgi:tetratricopeptide (TPR) repeat protein
MTKIPLRVYISQIKQLISTGQTEEAISHCLHILHTFPKYLDAYRVLGEAYLERSEQTEAADIFQRVLSSIPDDFVAHIGMSVIREEDQKLDEAIWHMERAYEVQPSNSTIQSEIRRLYGSREGIEPQKVRLTRGALARMYVKGALFPQAIGELQAALAEDPNRFDLQILLADVYFRTGDEKSAIEICSQTLEKLPYCLGMNLLLAQYHLDKEQNNDAELYMERLFELDPYYAHLDNLNQNPETVPDQVIQIEKYISSPLGIGAEGEPLVESPEDTKIDVSQEEKLAAAAISAEFSDEFAGDEDDIRSTDMEEREPIPGEIEPGQHSDWLQELDKEPEDEEDTKPVAVPVPLDGDTTPVERSEIGQDVQEKPQSDIPDWLQELADEDSTLESEPAVEEIGDKPVDFEKIEDVSNEEVLDKMFPPGPEPHEKEPEKPLRNYSELIKSRQNLPEIIKELEQAADKDPENTSILRNLGDAYMRNNQLSEALEAYARAEKRN